MTAGNGNAAAEAEIRALIEDWAKAMRAKDVDGVVSHFAADIVTATQIRAAFVRRRRKKPGLPSLSGIF